MRQPVCVGCDGRELLTLNSVTAPLTEPHLNEHKTSPKYLRNTSSFWGGTRGGGQPRKAAKARSPCRGESQPSPKSWAISRVQRGSPCWCRASPAVPQTLHQEGPWAMRNGLRSSKLNTKDDSGVHIQQNALQAWECAYGFNIPAFCWGCGGSRMPQSPARELLPPDNLGHCLKAKEVVKTGACNKNLRVEAASTKSSKGHESSFATVLVFSRSGYAPFICLGDYTKHRENRKAVAQTHCKHNPAAQLRANQENLQSLKYVCKGAILSVT